MSALNYHAALISGSCFEACQMADTGFRASNLAASTFTSVNLSGAAFTDVNLGSTAFENVNLGKSTLNNINLGGIQACGVNLSDASFSATNLDGTSFKDIGPRSGPDERARNRNGVRFEDATLNDSLFERCDMANVRMVGCEMEGMTIDGVPIVDLLAAYRRERTAESGTDG